MFDHLFGYEVHSRDHGHCLSMFVGLVCYVGSIAFGTDMCACAFVRVWFVMGNGDDEPTRGMREHCVCQRFFDTRVFRFRFQNRRYIVA